MCEPRKVAVYGAGIAGLTVAHELSRLGHEVAVYEAAAEAGGFFRSARPTEDRTPSEYSWHGFGPWYHNAFALLRDIPFDEEHSLFEKALSRPIDFGVFPDAAPARFYDARLWSIPGMFRMSALDLVGWAWLMLKTWASDARTEKRYAAQNGASRFGQVMSGTAARMWRACFGPWIGSDWTNVSLHHVGQFFRKQLTSRPSHLHPPDAEGPGWRHGAGDGWLLLRGPSSEYWFDRWVPWLERQGVRFHWNAPLERLELEGGLIRRAWLSEGREVTADVHVIAANPFAVADIVDRSPPLAGERELGRFRALVQDGPHVQVSMRVAFVEPVAFPRPRTAVVLADTEFNLTLFAQEQAWDADVELGAGVGSLWTVTSCAAGVPGRVHGLPVACCTREQFVEEVLTQVRECGALDAMLREANAGRGFRDFRIRRVEVWHEWRFSPRGIRGPQPKWVTTTRTQPHLPAQETTIPNLFLAGAHTRTEVDVWSIEGAVESGRRAARAIDRRVPLARQYKARWLRRISRLDDICFAAGLPHVLDLALSALLVAAAAGCRRLLRGWRKRRFPGLPPARHSCPGPRASTVDDTVLPARPVSCSLARSGST